MILSKKLLTYLGFCPSKESAKRFKTKNNTLTARVYNWKPRGLVTFIGVLLIFAGLMPFFIEDSSVAGVTDTLILHCGLGLASFILGAILIIFGAIIPRIITKLRMGVV